MLGFFKKKGIAGAQPSSASTQDPEIAARNAQISKSLQEAITLNKTHDPLAGAKVVAEEIRGRLIRGMKNERGVHVESYLTALGALAGFSCQMSVRAKFGAPPGSGASPRSGTFMVAGGKDGKSYYFGDQLNKPLGEEKHSVWSLVAGGVQTCGGAIPDVQGIIKHVAVTIGGAQFGIPRVPTDHRAGDLPFNYLKVIWPDVFPVVIDLCPAPEEWPIAFGIAAQRTIVANKDVIDPSLAATILMESAIPMSKVDLPQFY